MKNGIVLGKCPVCGNERHQIKDDLQRETPHWIYAKVLRCGCGLEIHRTGSSFQEAEANVAETWDKIASLVPVSRTTYKYYGGFDVPRCVNCHCAIDTEWSYCPQCGALIDYDAPDCGDRVDD